VPRPVPLRGVIEGFYGPPWSHEARLHAIEFLAARAMNAYVYAPKSDPLHRERWREPYPAPQLAQLGELAARCRDVGARFGFAVSPGLDITYTDAEDRQALLDKLGAMVDAGVTWLVLALDDIPNRPGLAADHALLAEWLVGSLRDRGGTEIRWSLVPTEYVGTRPSPYLSTLATELPDAVDVFWTGPTVCSPVIGGDDARAWRDAVGGRPLLLWDNYPVNDAVMERELHLGPYRGRDAGLTDVVDGVLCNPMLQPRASLVPLATAAEFLADPHHYDADGAWERAISDVGGAQAPLLRAVARACCDGPLARPDELPAAVATDELEPVVDTPAWVEAAMPLRDELTDLRRAATTWPESDPLRAELEPWLEQAVRECDAALAALRLVQQTHSIDAVDAPAGDASTVTLDPESAMLHAFALLFAWSAARDARPRVVLGPRFVVHPAVVQRPDGAPALDVGLALREDASVVDRLARLALGRYERAVAGRCDSSAPTPRARVPFPDPRLS
jgi:hyaluronoglucosaminidase